MPAISVKVGTEYACNLDSKGDQIIWSKYAYNISLNGDQIWLQSRIFKNSFLTQDDHFQGFLKIFEIAGIYHIYDIWSPTESVEQIRLQAYMVPNETEIADIFGPQRDQDCTHIWSLLQPKLQA